MSGSTHPKRTTPAEPSLAPVVAHLARRLAHLTHDADDRRAAEEAERIAAGGPAPEKDPEA